MRDLRSKRPARQQRDCSELADGVEQRIWFRSAPAAVQQREQRPQRPRVEHRLPVRLRARERAKRARRAHRRAAVGGGREQRHQRRDRAGRHDRCAERRVLHQGPHRARRRRGRLWVGVGGRDDPDQQRDAARLA